MLLISSSSLLILLHLTYTMYIYLGKICLQVVLGSIASMVIGMMWYHPSMFGKIWWRYQFPNSKKFGELQNQSMVPIFVTMLLMIIQSILLSFSINYLTALLQITTTLDYYFIFPLVFSCALALLIGCATLPHYLFGQRYLALFSVCYGHDVFQVTAGVFIISALC